MSGAKAVCQAKKRLTETGNNLPLSSVFFSQVNLCVQQ